MLQLVGGAISGCAAATSLLDCSTASEAAPLRGKSIWKGKGIRSKNKRDRYECNRVECNRVEYGDKIEYNKVELKIREEKKKVARINRGNLGRFINYLH